MTINPIQLANQSFLSDNTPEGQAARTRLLTLAGLAGSQIVATKLQAIPNNDASDQLKREYRLAARLAQESREIQSAVRASQQDPGVDFVPTYWRAAFNGIALFPGNREVLALLAPTQEELNDFRTNVQLALAGQINLSETPAGEKVERIITIADAAWSYVAGYVFADELAIAAV